MVRPHQLAELYPVGLAGLRVSAVQALRSAGQLLGDSAVDINSKFTREATHGGPIVGVNPNGLAVLTDLNLICGSDCR